MHKNAGRTFIAAGIGIAAAASMAAALAPGSGVASSHREAPLIANDPQADNTDLYAFTSPDKPDTVTVLANWLPFQEPNGGPNFYPFATNTRYNIKIDNTGDGRADLIFRYTFRNEDKRGKSTFLYNNGPVKKLTDETLLFKQHYKLEVLSSKGRKVLINDALAAPSNVGLASMPDYNSLRQEAIANAGGVTSLAGQSEDPFFADLRVFDLLYGTDLKETGKDSLRGYSVNTIALQVPKSAIAMHGDAKRNPVVGIWSTTERRGANVNVGGRNVGGWHQVSRLGNPLVNEVVSSAGIKDAFNRLDPSQDRKAKALVDRVLKPEVPKLIEQIYGIKAPAEPRDDLAEIFLKGIAKENGPIKADLNSHSLNADVDRRRLVPAEELRLNMSIPPTAKPNRLGVLAGDLQGFPNGRRLADDVIDISLQALEGAAVTGQLVKALAAGDGVDANESEFGKVFPYISLPSTKSVNEAG